MHYKGGEKVRMYDLVRFRVHGAMAPQFGVVIGGTAGSTSCNLTVVGVGPVEHVQGGQAPAFFGTLYDKNCVPLERCAVAVTNHTLNAGEVELVRRQSDVPEPVEVPV